MKQLAAKVPPFTHPTVRDRAVRAVRQARRQRRRLFERLGSRRFSRPALHGLDHRLEPYLPASGFFVEAGANDGYQHSNTYYLERFKGWRGLLVEPIPELFERCVQDRPGSRVYNCGLVAEGGPSELTMRYHNLTSAVDSSNGEPAQTWDLEYDVSVPARTLSSIIDEAEAPDIDLLSLDVEGYEVEVLRGLDMTRHAPKLVLIEANDADESIEGLLGDRYERLTELPPNDVLYALRD